VNYSRQGFLRKKNLAIGSQSKTFAGRKYAHQFSGQLLLEILISLMIEGVNIEKKVNMYMTHKKEYG